MAVLGVASLSPAFPVIGPNLGLNYPYSELGLLITVFTLPAIFFSPVFGVASDKYGRKRILTPALLLFSAAGSACAFTPVYTIILVLRFFQGVGAAALGVLNVTIIGDLYTGKTRTTALGYNSSVLSFGTGSWPLIGGVLGTLAWFAPFLLPLTALPVALLVLFKLQTVEPNLKQSGREYFKETWRIIKKPKILVLFTAGVINFFIIYGVWITFMPVLLNTRFTLIPLYIGLVQSSASFIGAAVSTQVGRLAKKHSEWSILISTYILYAVAVFTIPFIQVVWLLTVPVILIGFALGLNGPLIQALVAEETTINQRGVVLSSLGMMLRIGQTAGPAVMIFISSLFGFNSVFSAGALFALAMLTLLTLFKRTVNANTKMESKS
jgi:MFS family permease